MHETQDITKDLRAPPERLAHPPQAQAPLFHSASPPSPLQQCNGRRHQSLPKSCQVGQGWGVGKSPREGAPVEIQPAAVALPLPPASRTGQVPTEGSRGHLGVWNAAKGWSYWGRGQVFRGAQAKAGVAALLKKEAPCRWTAGVASVPLREAGGCDVHSGAGSGRWSTVTRLSVARVQTWMLSLTCHRLHSPKDKTDFSCKRRRGEVSKCKHQKMPLPVSRRLAGLPEYNLQGFSGPEFPSTDRMSH